MEKIEKEVVEKAMTTKKRGSKSASIAATTTAKKEEISQVIKESFQYFKRPIVKSDEECAQRLNDYFKQCYEEGQIPTVEDMCLALGSVRSTVWQWGKRTGMQLRTHLHDKKSEGNFGRY